MWKVLVVGIGGFLGAIARYGLSSLLHRHLGEVFPWGTIAVNVLGCLLIGVVTAVIDEKDLFGPEVQVFLLIGLLGSFTTFSTFAHESLELIRDGQLWSSLGYTLANLAVGAAAVLGGNAIVRHLL